VELTDLRHRILHDEDIGDGTKHAKIFSQLFAARLPGEAAHEKLARRRIAAVWRTPARAA